MSVNVPPLPQQVLVSGEITPAMRQWMNQIQMLLQYALNNSGGGQNAVAMAMIFGGDF
jgi:hypothetical protein